MSHLLISAAHKSSGKTTITIGLCAALTKFGKSVQSFKKGPDYIDPMWLAKATGRPCYNLDFYTMPHEEIKDLFVEKSAGSDIQIIEGNKGLYDGLELDGSNSNAALASLVHSPVILVIDSRGMTRGIAPLILGYQAFDENINIAGVVLNQVGGSRHESKLRNVIEHYTDVPVIGAVHKDASLNIDERHLGLMPSNEHDQAADKISRLAEAVQQQVDLGRFIEIADAATPVKHDNVIEFETSSVGNGLRVGVVKNEAFGFYYPGDLEAFEKMGVELIDVDTINDDSLPELDGLFIGGGFPETLMTELEANESMRDSIKKAVEDGLPVYAECGGLMYLASDIEWQGNKAKMVGCIPGRIVMHDKPQGRGYVKLKATNNLKWPVSDPERDQVISAHEFHYSALEGLPDDAEFAFEVKRGTGITGKYDGYQYKNLLANYTHMRNGRQNHWVKHFVNFVADCKQRNS